LFWDDAKQAGAVMQELESLRKEQNDVKKLAADIADYESLLLLEDTAALKEEAEKIEAALSSWETKTLLSGPYDHHDASITIRSGAGGVDAQDWAAMLLRMYSRYAEKQGLRFRVSNEAPGAEAGIKSATLVVEAHYAYGTLRPEAGIHRLVRLSPFNANNLRQTSFASVEVLPIIHDNSAVAIKPEDLRIDTYKSGGAGGQHVNTTDSAVRITHIPTGIVVTSQSERSQLQNKEEAMQTLRGKLAQQKIAAQEAEKQALRGEHKKAEWGNQIRSYTLHPYTLVKDHRTGTETTNASDTLDGSIEAFLESGLRFVNM
jgi:peptide chain release factor 2